MITYQKAKQFFLLVLSFMVLVSSCSTKQEVSPTPLATPDKKVDIKALSAKLADDEDFKAYMNKLADVYIAQSKMVQEKYKGDAKAYQKEAYAIHRSNERVGWTEARVAKLDQKMGLAEGTLVELVTQRQVVVTKYTEIVKLSDDEKKQLMQESINLLTKNAHMRTTGNCQDACRYDYLACISASTGVSVGLLAGCLAFTLPPAVAACAALIVAGDVFALGGCYFSYLGCRARC